MNLLDYACDTARLRGMSRDELTTLAADIREVVIDVVSRRGGHLGSNLGAVELSIALHRVFDSPRDRILFDTGHQTYVHKLLTGRWGEFDTLRRRSGLSGYASQSESEHDVIENSHASTALSYADGLAKSFELKGETGRCVAAVIGDGALTGGMAWEALNNLGSPCRRSVVVVLNDNGRSYSPTVGGLATHLAEVARNAGVRPTVFENLGLAYLGPVDGHDVLALEAAFTRARSLGRPVVVHVLTRKGFGYTPAENDMDEKFHAPGVFDIETGRKAAAAGQPWTGVFADEMVRIGAERPDIVAMTAAMMGPTGLTPFSQRYPTRTYDVGIAEQHAVASAAGLAIGGVKTVFAVYATFLNRAFDQVLMDVALHRLGVTFVLDRAGVTGDDGASHNGMWDMSMLQVVPGLEIAAPRDSSRLRELLREAIGVSCAPTVVRFPKGIVPSDIPSIGKLGAMDVLCCVGSQDVLVVAVGSMAETGVEAATLLRVQGIGATVVDPRWVKPLDSALIDASRKHRLVVVIEDNCRVGGVGDAVARLLRDFDVDTPVRTFGIPAEFLEHGKRAEILDEVGLNSRAIAKTVTEFLAQRPPIRWPLPSTLAPPYALSSETEMESAS